MKSIVLRTGGLHIETPNGIINIRVGLTDTRGRAVDSVACLPDEYAGEPKVRRYGPANVRMVRLKK